MFAGLRDAYNYAGNQDAKKMLIAMGDWALATTQRLSDEQMQAMLRTEHGGMNEIFVDLAQITGDEKYLKLAKRFSHQMLLQPLATQQDQLTAMHANTQIPKVIGFKRYADATHTKTWLQAAEFFWQTLVEKRSVTIGGNSVKEHFHAHNNFSSMLYETEGPETCNTYNMLRLTKLLYLSALPEQTPKLGRYVDYYERSLYNHILSSQHPTTGGLVYFTPMRPNHYRVYSQVQQGMWCCVGSGLENHAKYAEFIYARHVDGQGAKAVFVNLFIPSTMTWKEQSISLTQSTLFPDDETIQINVNQPATFSLNLRYPSWVKAGALLLKINHKKVAVEAAPGGYISLLRAWKKGDRIELTLPMHTRLEQLPDGSNYYSIVHGPIVLAAKTRPFANESINYFADDSRSGHIPSGPICPLEAAPFLLGNTETFINTLKPVAGKPLTFDATGLIDGKDQRYIELIPFFRLHESRYTLYWPYAQKSQLASARTILAIDEKQRLELQAVTIDRVAMGEQQPESDHLYQGEGAQTGAYKDRHWRSASGWFGYELSDKNSEAKRIQISYFGADTGRAFLILINDTVVGEVNLKTNKLEVVVEEYKLSDDLVKRAGGKFRVKFVAKNGSQTANIFEVRLLR